jgi:hypothetical protein
MTPKVAERELRHWDCVPIWTLSSALSHRHPYIFLSDGSEVTLQYDEHYRLVSWKGEEGHKMPPNQPDAANPAMALWLTVEGQWCRVADLGR